MISLLKKTPLYPLFLWARTRRFSEERLRTQLMKRGHSLDKRNTEGLPGGIFLFEVETLLTELARRALPSDETVRWAWGVVYEARFREALAGHDAAGAVADGAAPVDTSAIAEALRGRRSVRKWTDEPVTAAQIEAAVDTAKWAPSSCNRQPWLFVALTKQEDIDFMARFTAQPFFQKAPAVIVALIDKSVYGADEEHFAYLDLGAAIQNLLLALHGQGLGACWLGIKQKAGFAENAKALGERFGVEARFEPVSFVAVGHPAAPAKAPLRKETKAILKVVE